MGFDKKTKTLLAFILISLIGVFFVDPIPQPREYHDFVDQNTFLGVPNAWNVLSNIPFIIIGAIGLVALIRTPPAALVGVYKTISKMFFVGLILTGFGSGYYHLSPSNPTLVWDRLPMTLSFMAFFSFVLAMHISERVGRTLFWPLIAVGVCSVFYWAYTESINAGDLRFYGVVQFLPMVLIPAVVVMFPKAVYKAVYIWGVIGVYVLAKVCEHFDGQIYSLLGVSGHSLKHIAAALSGVAFYYALKSISTEQGGAADAEPN
ncbi:ceramidase domain-containing protein [Pseudomonadota bacterium]